MFLRCSKRRKDGKEHLYWSVVENRRRADQRVVQRHVLYLGELNGVQESSWRKTENDLQLLLDQIKLALPAQGPPKIQAQPPAPPVAKCPRP